MSSEKHLRKELRKWEKVEKYAMWQFFLAPLLAIMSIIGAIVGFCYEWKTLTGISFFVFLLAGCGCVVLMEEAADRGSKAERKIKRLKSRLNISD